MEPWVIGLIALLVVGLGVIGLIVSVALAEDPETA